GVHVMRAPYLHRVLELEGSSFQNCKKLFDIFDKEVGCFCEEKSESSIQNIGRCKALVDKPRRRTHEFSHARKKCYNIVMGLALDFLDPVNVEAGLVLYTLKVFRRDRASFEEHLTDRKLDVQPFAVFILKCPNPPHFRASVALDHFLFSR